jgi:hypothetical protein
MPPALDSAKPVKLAVAAAPSCGRSINTAVPPLADPPLPPSTLLAPDPPRPCACSEVEPVTRTVPPATPRSDREGRPVPLPPLWPFRPDLPRRGKRCRPPYGSAFRWRIRAVPGAAALRAGGCVRRRRPSPLRRSGHCLQQRAGPRRPLTQNVRDPAETGPAMLPLRLPGRPVPGRHLQRPRGLKVPPLE